MNPDGTAEYRRVQAGQQRKPSTSFNEAAVLSEILGIVPWRGIQSVDLFT
jgi:hypothetical protein